MDNLQIVGGEQHLGAGTDGAGSAEKALLALASQPSPNQWAWQELQGPVGEKMEEIVATDDEVARQLRSAWCCWAEQQMVVMKRVEDRHRHNRGSAMPAGHHGRQNGILEIVAASPIGELRQLWEQHTGRKLELQNRPLLHALELKAKAAKKRRKGEQSP